MNNIYSELKITDNKYMYIVLFVLPCKKFLENTV